MKEIRPCTLDEVTQSGLLDLYSAECAIDNLPRPAADPNMYKEMIGMGSLELLGYFSDDTLVGIISVMIIQAPHYGRVMASVESFFVHPRHRAGGAGIKLLRAAEKLAGECEAIGLIVSAPVGSALSAVLTSLDRYRKTNEVFIRGIKCR